MEKRLTADLNVVANSNLEVQLLDGDLNIIQKLDDEPNDVGGLTSAELKAKFDESGNIIKKYINETLIPAVLTNNATEESRKQAEAARVAAEQTRQANEAARISAENARNVWENYDASKAYAVGNKVAYGGSSYLCIKPCTGIAPPSAEYWLLIAKKGDKGEPGGGGGQHTVEIDLYSAGVDVDISQPGGSLLFDVSPDTVAQFVAAVKNGGALLKFGVQYMQRFPAQAYFVGAASESMKAYQLSGKMFFVSSGVNIFFSVELSDSNSRIKSLCTFDQSALPDPETADDGAFLRVENGKWVASNVPSAEGGTF